MQDGQYQWFRASAEVIRRLDGSANRIAGIISNIDAEKRSRMQAQRAAAFHRAFTSANLCEYYVNLEKNTFDTFKVEPSLMTAFEQSHTWDELIRFFVDNYVVEEDKKSVTDFYNRAYITKKLKGLETELCQECRIVLNGGGTMGQQRGHARRDRRFRICDEFSAGHHRVQSRDGTADADGLR